MLYTPTVALEAKLDFLRGPEAYPDGPTRVETIETHFAWVFLSKRYVYKLKKPLRSHVVDFTNMHARRANCELEVTLNRRLAEAVYIGVVPLCRGGGGLVLEGEGEPVEWLVKMHRLPRERALDRAAAEKTVRPAQLKSLVAKLARFYRQTQRAPLDGGQYRRRLERLAERYARQLHESGLGLDPLVERVLELQRQRLRDDAMLIQTRAARGRVVDAHGDLRPEHIYLLDPPQIIDCLEFSTELRWLDTAEELAFLALECDRLGEGTISAHLHELYRTLCDDPVPRRLQGLYRSQRAVVRALLSAWHLHGNEPPDVAAHWREQARWYLETAATSLGSDHDTSW